MTTLNEIRYLRLIKNLRKNSCKMETDVETEPTKERVPVQNRGIQTKNSIIDAARKLFEEKGYHGTNSKEIAAMAGVATGTF